MEVGAAVGEERAAPQAWMLLYFFHAACGTSHLLLRGSAAL